MKNFIGKTLRLPPKDSSDAVNVSELCIVTINDVDEGTSFAGYLVTFKPHAGDYNKVFNNTVFTEKGGVGTVSYAYASRLTDVNIFKG